MVKKDLLEVYYEDRLLNQFNIDSYNKFISEKIEEIVSEVGGVVPDILPPKVRDFEIKFGKVWVEKPYIMESDGTKREVTPMEARLRDVTYEAPILLEMYYVKNGVEGEKQTIHVGNIPVMVKSDICTLNGLNKEELVEKKEDSEDPAGYFIINGTERVVVIIEDLAPNRFFVEKKASGKHTEVCKVFSEDSQLRIPHVVQKDKSGLITVSFTRMKNIPFTLLMKALGIVEDKKIVAAVEPTDKMMSELYVNFYETASVKDQQEALLNIGKKLSGGNRDDIKIDKATRMVDKYLFPHIGHEESHRLLKANYLSKMVKKLLKLSYGLIEADDKDHYANKRLRLCGDMMEGLFRYSFRILASDMKYNFERLVKRGKLPGLQAITRRQLLTSRVKSSLATGEWVGGRHGVSQHLKRNNFVDTVSHLKRIVSSLSSARENFEARDLHPTHWGKLCASETPEGQNVGLRKTLAITCEISTLVGKDDNDKVLDVIKSAGVDGK